MSSAVEASIIICTFNRAAEIGLVLDDLAAQAGIGARRYEVLVVDNNSTDATRDVVAAKACGAPCPVRYVREPRQGKSLALNRGVAEARGGILVFTDDDVRIPPTWLAAMLAPFEDAACMGVAGAVLPRWTASRPSWVSEDEPYRMMAAIVRYWLGPDPLRATVPPIGANCAWRREVFERYGGYRTDLGPGGKRAPLGEDTEFGLRVMTGGESVRYEPAALVHHPVAPERLTRRYFTDWYFQSGRVEPCRAGIAPSVRIAGVPRYLFRELAGAAARWAFSPPGPRRFFHKLRTYQTLGRIRGYRDEHARGRPD
ncbi:MAG TPA: glycosyltransferase family A protein [Gemmatimonadales bacterium]|nr:glycosyltransferase family A protein [Gemmatimonadales bacterium]